MKNKGITLIALVITIIVLLILAGITINLTIGEHGILTMAKEAGKNYQNAAEYEQGAIGNFFNEAQNIIAGGNGSETNPDESGRPTAIVKLSDALSSNYYGDKVKYSVNGIEEWKIFYKDANGEVFIMPSECIPAVKIPTISTNIQTSGEYNAIWNTVPAFQSNWSTNAELFMQDKLNSNYKNSKVASVLLNTNNWTSFVNDDYADLAVGGPTSVMFLRSYDEKNNTNHSSKLNLIGSGGYGISYSKQSSSVITMDLSIKDELYFPYTELNGSNNGYFFATPHGYYGSVSGDPECLCTLQYTNGLNIAGINIDKFGIRPVVHLKTGITAKWNQTTQMWDLQTK